MTDHVAKHPMLNDDGSSTIFFFYFWTVLHSASLPTILELCRERGVMDESYQTVEEKERACPIR